MDATAERGSKLITPARIGKYGKKIGASLDADKFSEEFGIPMTGDSANPGYRAYRVIQDHIDYNSQLEAMGRPASTNLGEDSTTDLIRSVGESKAKEIADAFGLLLEKTS